MHEWEVGEGQRIGAEPLDAYFERVPKFAVAFSGGCDSAYLLAAAVRAGCDVHAYGVRTVFQPPFEMTDMARLASELGVPFSLLDADVLAVPELRANEADRCYSCKTLIFSAIREAMARDGFDVLADGSNTDDDPERRPGFQALKELGVVSPLRRAGMPKEAVRAASRELGLFTADKPSFSCLAVHNGPGALTLESLAATQARLEREGVIPVPE